MNIDNPDDRAKIGELTEEVSSPVWNQVAHLTRYRLRGVIILGLSWQVPRAVEEAIGDAVTVEEVRNDS